MDGLEATHLVVYVIRPTLQYLEWYSPAAERLVLGTGITESGLRYLHQLGGGPANGLYQMEPDTAADIWKNFFAYDVTTRDRIRSLKFNGVGHDANMHGNLFYQTAMCRAAYRRHSDPLPAADDAPGLAAYHKRFYNTAGGATDPTKSVAHFATAIQICEEIT